MWNPEKHKNPTQTETIGNSLVFPQLLLANFRLKNPDLRELWQNTVLLSMVLAWSRNKCSIPAEFKRSYAKWTSAWPMSTEHYSHSFPNDCTSLKEKCRGKTMVLNFVRSLQKYSCKIQELGSHSILPYSSRWLRFSHFVWMHGIDKDDRKV